MRYTVWPTTICVLLALCVSSVSVDARPHVHQGYGIGGEVTMQCKDDKGEWSHGPLCKESGKSLSFRYGVDQLVSCGWAIDDSDSFEFFSALIEREKHWECRIKMMPGLDFWLPFYIPVWGVVERASEAARAANGAAVDHLHIDNHLNFIFHAFHGKILGVAAYPVRDRFQYGVPGSVITVHGPVKWFRSGSFDSFSSSPLQLGGGGGGSSSPSGAGDAHTFVSFAFVASMCLLTASVVTLALILLYRFFVRPRLIRRLLKLKQQ
jgi:hypothetical protein